jgi:hypothetical protein
VNRVRFEAIQTIAILVWVFSGAVPARAQDPPEHAAHAGHVAPEGVLELPPEARAAVGRIITQDFQGRMKPVDTLAHEVVRKITKRESYEDWTPLDLYLSWLATPEHWWDEPLLYVRHPGLKDLLGIPGRATTSWSATWMLHIAHLIEIAASYSES